MIEIAAPDDGRARAAAVGASAAAAAIPARSRGIARSSDNGDAEPIALTTKLP
jgi:hypothetical protein